MNAPMSEIPFATVIEQGKPTFVLVPVEEFVKWYPGADKLAGLVPHAVAERVLKDNMTRVRAWREHMEFTQAEVAARMGITQATLSEIESGKSRPRKATMEKLAAALGVSIEQLR